MTFLVLFVLAVVWAVYLVSWIKNRSSARRVNSINSFSTHLSILGRTNPEAPAVPVAPRSAPLGNGQYFAPVRPQLSPQKKRRRDVLFGTAGATGATFLLAMLAGGVMWLLFLLCVGALVGYVALLVDAQKRKLERRAKVRPLPTVIPQHDDVIDGIVDEEPQRRMYVVGGN
ncbi:MAG: hypothetical protein FGM58_01875 [Acidimicrobiia bacterium]|nr:hypothetical protein [Acidimicrobiia bacterium]